MGKGKYILAGIVLLFVLFMVVLHYMARNDTGDTVLFRQFISERNFWDFFVWRYETFSSRVILEGFLYIVLSMPYIVFAVLDSIIITGCVLVCKRIFSFSNLTTVALFVICLKESIADFIVVGIQPAAINYIWTLFFSLLAFITVRKILDGEKMSKSDYIIYSLSLLIGCNMEQLAVGFASRVIMGFSSTLFASHTRTFFFLYVGLFITGAMLVGRVGGIWMAYERNDKNKALN